MLLHALRNRAALGSVSEVLAFGSNPGTLRMFVHARPGLPTGRPMVVLLHGCGQQAAGFAADSGWLALADELGFALLLPEQTADNNRARCFNWFRPSDVRRGKGEAMSIRQMLRLAIGAYASDPKQIFIVGFSAGASMAAAMLAAYPAVFAAGGIVSGMPVGCAHSQLGAMLQMKSADSFRSRQAMAGDVREVTRAARRSLWPRVSIWQGDRDRTVDPANAEALAAQWGELHGQGTAPRSDTQTPEYRIRVWGRPDRPPAVELWTIPGIGHGFPVDQESAASGHTGPWVVDAGLPAARLIFAFCQQDRRQAASGVTPTAKPLTTIGMAGAG
ncbi:MAG: PHB depolymerase family esterase [Rhodospirillales bacterium]|nr:PHB depolymerase family esterase [Rhodospirillales bacterium]